MQESAASLASEAAGNGVTLEVDIHQEIPDNMLGFPDKLQVLFYHLFNNAIKFSPSGKVLANIKLGICKAKSVQLKCSVTDTGCGIPPEEQSLIFEPFAQADGSITRKFGGLGIGLSIASRIVQMMGGAINVESRPEGGSIFSFTVTCSSEQCMS